MHKNRSRPLLWAEFAHPDRQYIQKRQGSFRTTYGSGKRVCRSLGNRAEFNVPANFAGKVVWLHFGGINYRADIWINGQQLADAEKVVGTWRVYEFNVTQAVDWAPESNRG